MAKETILKKIVRNMHLNNLGLVWYCLLTTCFQLWIIIRSISRFTTYVTLPWPNGTPPASSINAYLLFIGCSILMLPIFILTSLFKIGNFSNDGRKFGSLALRLPTVDQPVSGKRNWCSVLWRHILPIAPILHLFMSFCFLFPRLITESQLIRHGFLSKSDIWKTDLDIIFKRFNGKAFNFFGLIHTINQNEHRYLFNSNSSSEQYFLRESNRMSELFSELNDSGKLSIEYVNFLLALLILTIRYPSVFWRTNKRFSLIFTSLLVMNAIQSITNLAAFQVTFKIFVCDPTQMLLRFREFSSLTLVQLCLLFYVYLVVVHLSSTSLYVFGAQKYREFRLARTKQMQNKYEDKIYLSYLPYLMAMIFFIVFTILLGPLFYEFVILYCGSLNVNCLLVVISTIIYFIYWIILWVGLSLKTRWTFEYDDIESSSFLFDSLGNKDCFGCLLVISEGKTYRIYEDASKQAILKFAQSKLLNDDNDVNSNLFGRFSNYHDYGHSTRQSNDNRFNKNYRYSTISHKFGRKKATERFSPYDLSDSEGEYTSFQKRGSSFRHQKNSQKLIAKRPLVPMVDDNLYGTLRFEKKNEDQMRMTNNITYGFSGLFHENESTESGRSLNPDKVSDTSSGIHSQSSHSSLSQGKRSPNMFRSSSLESIMQRLEAAASEKPCLRSLSPIQKSIHLLNKFDSDLEPTFPKLTSFPTNLEGRSSSKLVEFVENPDYNRYYSLNDRSLV